MQSEKLKPESIKCTLCGGRMKYDHLLHESELLFFHVYKCTRCFSGKVLPIAK